MTAPDLTNERLQAIIEAAGKATPGEWVAIKPRERPGVITGDIRIQSADGLYIATIRCGAARTRPQCELRANAAHLANCDPATIAAMAGEVLRLRKDMTSHETMTRAALDQLHVVAGRSAHIEAENARLREAIGDAIRAMGDET